MKLLFRLSDLLSRPVPTHNCRFGTLHIDSAQSSLKNLTVKVQLTIVFCFTLCYFFFIIYFNRKFFHLARFSSRLNFSGISISGIYLSQLFFLCLRCERLSRSVILIVVSCVKYDCFLTQHDNCRWIKNISNE